MARLVYQVMQDNAGNLLFDVTGTVRLAGTGTLAPIYGDEAGTIPIANPLTNHPSFGSFKFYVGPGAYDVYMAKSGYTFETLTGLQGQGTLAQQDAGNLTLPVVIRANPGGGYGLEVSPGYTYVAGLLVRGAVADLAGITMSLMHDKGAATHGLAIRAFGNDTGAYTMLFFNTVGTIVGTINATAAATAYNTTSDARLKTAVTTLVGELAVIRALRPVRFRWLADDSEGVGFLAGEVAEHVQGVVTGEPDAVNPDGTIHPQMIDMSKLVPWLVGAVQTLAARVETLTERVAALEAGA